MPGSTRVDEGEPDSVAPVTSPGAPGTATSALVAQPVVPCGPVERLMRSRVVGVRKAALDPCHGMLPTAQVLTSSPLSELVHSSPSPVLTGTLQPGWSSSCTSVPSDESPPAPRQPAPPGRPGHRPSATCTSARWSDPITSTSPMCSESGSGRRPRRSGTPGRTSWPVSRTMAHMRKCWPTALTRCDSFPRLAVFIRA